MKIRGKKLLVNLTTGRINRPMIDFQETQTCALCGSSSSKIVMEGEDYESGLGRFILVRCETCHVVRTFQQPASNQIAVLYAGRTSSDFRAHSPWITKLRNWTQTNSVRIITRALGIPGGAAVLDYGCGDGAYSQALHRCGFKVTACDFEFERPPCLDEAISYFPLTEFERHPDARFNLIVLRHVLEHVIEPLRLLSELSMFLLPSGVIHIEVPAFDTIWLNVFKGRWSGLYLPRHLFHFEFKTIDAVIPNTMTCIRKKRLHGPQIGASVGNLFRKKWSNTSTIGIALFPLQILADVCANRSNNIALSIQLKKTSES